MDSNQNQVENVGSVVTVGVSSNTEHDVVRKLRACVRYSVT